MGRFVTGYGEGRPKNFAMFQPPRGTDLPRGKEIGKTESQNAKIFNKENPNPGSHKFTTTSPSGNAVSVFVFDTFSQEEIKTIFDLEGELLSELDKMRYEVKRGGN